MAAINLEQGKTYSVKVTKIEGHVHRPSFTIKNTTYYNFVIHIELKDKDGKVGWVEYVSSDPDINKVPFEIGLVQFVKCRECTDKHCVIDPYDPEPAPSTQQEKIDMARKLVDPNYKPHLPEPKKNTYEGLLSERNLGFCGAWAKDVLVAEIGKKPEGYLIEPKDFAEKWATLARLMYDGLEGIARDKNKVF